MRGRLPDTRSVQANTTLPHTDTCSHIHAPGPPPEPSEEETEIHEHACELQGYLQKALAETTHKVLPHIRAGRPPDQRDGDDYIPAPYWNEDFLATLISEWGEPVILESDYYLVRSMCLYELGRSIQVKVLGPEKVQQYLNMALTLAQKGQRILRSVINSGDSENKQWRYQTLISYILQQQTLDVIMKIKTHEALTGFTAADQLYEQASRLISQALRSFYLGMRYYPNSNASTSGESFKDKDQEWSRMAALTESYTQLLEDFHTRQMWTRNTVRLLMGATRENKSKSASFLLQISRTKLEYALWIYDQPEKPLLIFPKVGSMFMEMRQASVAALIYAKYALESLKQDDVRPEYYCQVIDCLYMMSLVCIASNLLHSYSREASYWISQLQHRFPLHRINPSYLHSQRLIASKDKAMQDILQHRKSSNYSQDAQESHTCNVRT
ncbi:hypothetical protein BGX28_000846 [Mortierella sp. GBA30]|nr:hypothetical protein BGX28_000846 [Mortierella sp. GBA30]